MARCKHFNMLLHMVTELPLLMANGTFKYLDSMQDQELESFLSYLVRYCSEKYSENPMTKPEWWGKEVKFFRDFYTGTISLPYIKNKQMKLRTIIQSCYAYYDALNLLLMSEKLASRLVYDFVRNPNDTVTVNVANTITPIVVIPASNLDYDLTRVPGTLMNSGFKRQVLRGPLKKASLIAYDCRTIVQINDSETDSDCMIIDDISSDDEITAVSRRKSFDEYQEYYNGEITDPEDKRRDKEVLRQGPDCVDLTLDEDDEERRAILEAEKSRFLEEFGLLKWGKAPPDQTLSPAIKDHKRKSRFSLKKFSLDQVPFLVRIGLLPRRCLMTLNEMSMRTGFIEKYTRNV
uniref:Nuclear respiratory factor 1 n=2 Tax=Lygus hesperus TaxID=30085 RepID=A0A0A9YCU7_LYGHE